MRSRLHILFFSLILSIYGLFLYACSDSSSRQDDTVIDDEQNQDNTDNVTTPSDEETKILALQKNVYQALDLIPPVDSQKWTVASTFGPRIKTSDLSRYDFHRGLDIVGERNDSIYAVADGRIVKVYDVGSSAYPRSGRVVIIEHEFLASITFQQHTITKYYSLYMHLNAFGDKAQSVLDTGVPVNVTQGEAIAYMGDSGDTDLLHLHFEIRLETQCSLDYQTQHPESDCAQYGFDPHINPTDFFVDSSTVDEQHIYDLALSKQNDQLLILATAKRPYFNIDGVHAIFYTDQTQTEIVDEIDLSYNFRTGFDATTTESLDVAELDFGTVVPDPLGASDETYQIQFIVDLWHYPLAKFVRVELFSTTAKVGDEFLAF